MKLKMRKPSFTKSLYSETTCNVIKEIQKAIIPEYGKKGKEILDPQKSVYNKLYNTTTYSLIDLFKNFFK